MYYLNFPSSSASTTASSKLHPADLIIFLTFSSFSMMEPSWASSAHHFEAKEWRGVEEEEAVDFEKKSFVISFFGREYMNELTYVGILRTHNSCMTIFNRMKSWNQMIKGFAAMHRRWSSGVCWIIGGIPCFCFCDGTELSCWGRSSVLMGRETWSRLKVEEKKNDVPVSGL